VLKNEAETVSAFYFSSISPITMCDGL